MREMSASLPATRVVAIGSSAMPWQAGRGDVQSATRLTTLEELRRHISLLACVEATEAPFVSCHLDLEQGEGGWRDALEARTRLVRASLGRNAQVDFDAALEPIAAYLATELRPDARGVALFSRSVLGGAFFLPMQFAVPLSDWIGAGPAPYLFHLMALMDTYERFVVVIATRSALRIVEVDLGGTNAKGWSQRPQRRNRGQRSVANARRESGHRHAAAQFLDEQKDLLERVMAAGRHTHMILAGEARHTAEIRRALPAWLAEKVIATIPVAAHYSDADVTAAALTAFVEWEERESQAIAARIVGDVDAQWMSATGATACLGVLRQRRVDVLLLARGHSPLPAWRCVVCGTLRVEPHAPRVCSECGNGIVWHTDTTAELNRLAGQRGSVVEVVDHCDVLMAGGGVACLWRH